MTNIWGFLLQTLSVSGVALVLLIVRRLLRDKIPPGVQYAFWLVLAVRIVLPVRAGMNILFPFPVLVEVLKAKAERGLSSAYSGMYELADNLHILPVYAAAPRSVTDWLFIVYGVGAVLMLAGYASAYLLLCTVISRGNADEEEQRRADRTAEAYGLHAIPVRTSAHVRVPFVCGVINPVLVLPEGGKVDELVLLHELLHRKHYDPAKNMLWCVLRALHWCNPFLWCVMNCIGNDLEMCNDRRVLACVEGEARRAYGRTLLAMAEDRCGRMPGTSAVSSGRKNTARRIEAIARFQTYPKGMTFALVCIAVILGSAAVQGQTVTTDSAWQRPADKKELDYALAKSRAVRCTTLAGALDTYAKGVLCKNGIYLAVASPLSVQGVLEQRMRENEKGNVWLVDSGYGQLKGLRVCEPDGYFICNLKRNERRQDGRVYSGRGAAFGYEALLLFSVLQDEGSAEGKTLVLPVRAYNAAREGWVVERAGEAFLLDVPYNRGWTDISSLKPLQRYEAESAHGRVTLDVYSMYVAEGGSPWGQTAFLEGAGQDVLNADAQFDYEYAQLSTVYDACGAKAGAPEKRIGIVCAGIPEGGTQPDWPENKDFDLERKMRGENGGGSGNGYFWESRECSGEAFLSGVFGMGQMREAGVFDTDYGARIYWDGEPVEEVLLKKEEDGNEAGSSDGCGTKRRKNGETYNGVCR